MNHVQLMDAITDSRKVRPNQGDVHLALPGRGQRVNLSPKTMHWFGGATNESTGQHDLRGGPPLSVLSSLSGVYSGNADEVYGSRFPFSSFHGAQHLGVHDAGQSYIGVPANASSRFANEDFVGWNATNASNSSTMLSPHQSQVRQMSMAMNDSRQVSNGESTAWFDRLISRHHQQRNCPDSSASLPYSQSREQLDYLTSCNGTRVSEVAKLTPPSRNSRKVCRRAAIIESPRYEVAKGHNAATAESELRMTNEWSRATSSSSSCGSNQRTLENRTEQQSFSPGNVAFMLPESSTSIGATLVNYSTGQMSRGYALGKPSDFGTSVNDTGSTSNVLPNGMNQDEAVRCSNRGDIYHSHHHQQQQQQQQQQQRPQQHLAEEPAPFELNLYGHQPTRYPSDQQTTMQVDLATLRRDQPIGQPLALESRNLISRSDPVDFVAQKLPHLHEAFSVRRLTMDNPNTRSHDNNGGHATPETINGRGGGGGNSSGQSARLDLGGSKYSWVERHEESTSATQLPQHDPTPQPLEAKHWLLREYDPSFPMNNHEQLLIDENNRAVIMMAEPQFDILSYQESTSQVIDLTRRFAIESTSVSSSVETLPEVSNGTTPLGRGWHEPLNCNRNRSLRQSDSGQPIEKHLLNHNVCDPVEMCIGNIHSSAENTATTYHSDVCHYQRRAEPIKSLTGNDETGSCNAPRYDGSYYTGLSPRDAVDLSGNGGRRNALCKQAALAQRTAEPEDIGSSMHTFKTMASAVERNAETEPIVVNDLEGTREKFASTDDIQTIYDVHSVCTASFIENAPVILDPITTTKFHSELESEVISQSEVLVSKVEPVLTGGNIPTISVSRKRKSSMDCWRSKAEIDVEEGLDTDDDAIDNGRLKGANDVYGVDTVHCVDNIDEQLDATELTDISRLCDDILATVIVKGEPPSANITENNVVVDINSEKSTSSSSSRQNVNICAVETELGLEKPTNVSSRLKGLKSPRTITTNPSHFNNLKEILTTSDCPDPKKPDDSHFELLTVENTTFENKDQDCVTDGAPFQEFLFECSDSKASSQESSHETAIHSTLPVHEDISKSDENVPTSSSTCSLNPGDDTAVDNLENVDNGRQQQQLADPRLVFGSISHRKVELAVAPVLQFLCPACSFCCGTKTCMALHVEECHGSQSKENNAALDSATTTASLAARYMCKLCTSSSETRSQHLRHAGHHNVSRQTIRYYLCSHCSYGCTSVNDIEFHVTDVHPDNMFRYEVVQETVEHLRDLVACPVCGEAFRWRADFADHVADEQRGHGLRELGAYLTNVFENELPPPLAIRIPINLFKDLQLMAVPDDVEKTSSCVGDDEKEETEHETTYERETNMDTDAIESQQDEEHTDYLSNDVNGMTLDSVEAAPLCVASVSLPLPTIIKSAKGKCNYQCPLCPVVCTKPALYRRHASLHARQNALSVFYRCGLCLYSHGKLMYVRKHVSQYHVGCASKILYVANGISTAVDAGAITTASQLIDKDPDISLEVVSSPQQKSDSSIMDVGRPASLSEEGSLADIGGCSSESIGGDVTSSEASSDVGTATCDSASSEKMTSQASTTYCQIERILPPSMVYADPVKCPLCDFASGLRIGLIRHMKVSHRGSDIGLIGGPLPLRYRSSNISDKPTCSERDVKSSPRNNACGSVELSSEPVCDASGDNSSLIKDAARTKQSKGQRVEEAESKLATRKSQSLIHCYFGVQNDNRSISFINHKSTQPNADKSGIDKKTSSTSSNKKSTKVISEKSGIDNKTSSRSASPSYSVTLNFSNTTESKLPLKPLETSEYEEFCDRLPNKSLYRCLKCDFTHRFPSKVRRHFWYRHSSVAPYHCGRCSFDAKEYGKVLKHSASVHRNLSPIVLHSKNERETISRDDTSKVDDVIDRQTQLPGDTDKENDDIDEDFGAPNEVGLTCPQRIEIKLPRLSDHLLNRTNIRKQVIASKKASADETSSSSTSSTEEAESDSDAGKVAGNSTAEPDAVPTSDKPGLVASSDSSTSVDICRSSESDVMASMTESASPIETKQSRDRSPIPCETIFAIHRFSYRPLPHSDDEIDWLTPYTTPAAGCQEVADVSCVTGDGELSLSDSMTSMTMKKNGDRTLTWDSMPWKRYFRCVYCNVKSRYGRWDIRMHVFTAHMSLRTFSCGQCADFGHKYRAKVREHHVRCHPDSKLLVVDNSHLFNAVNVIEEVNGAQVIAFVNPADEKPLRTLAELAQFFGREYVDLADDAATDVTLVTATISTSCDDKKSMVTETDAHAVIQVPCSENEKRHRDIGIDDGVPQIGSMMNNADITGVNSLADSGRKNGEPSGTSQVELITENSPTIVERPDINENDKEHRDIDNEDDVSQETIIFMNSPPQINHVSNDASDVVDVRSPTRRKFENIVAEQRSEPPSSIASLRVFANLNSFSRAAICSTEKSGESLDTMKGLQGAIAASSSDCCASEKTRNNKKPACKILPIDNSSCATATVVCERLMDDSILPSVFHCKDHAISQCVSTESDDSTMCVGTPMCNADADELAPLLFVEPACIGSASTRQISTMCSDSMAANEDVLDQYASPKQDAAPMFNADADELAPLLFVEPACIGGASTRQISTMCSDSMSVNEDVLDRCASPKQDAGVFSSLDNELPPILEVQQPLERFSISDKKQCPSRDSITTRTGSEIDGCKLNILSNVDNTSQNCVDAKSVDSVKTRPSEEVSSFNMDGSVEADDDDDDDRPWKCRQCTFLSPSIEQVWNHIIVRHLRLNRYNCPHCNAYFWKPSAVVAHILRLHPGSEQRVVSTIEEKAVYLRQNVERQTTVREKDTITSKHVAGDTKNASTAVANRKNNLKATPLTAVRLKCDRSEFTSNKEWSVVTHRRIHGCNQDEHRDFSHQTSAGVEHPKPNVKRMHFSPSVWTKNSRSRHDEDDSEERTEDEWQNKSDKEEDHGKGQPPSKKLKMKMKGPPRLEPPKSNSNGGSLHRSYRCRLCEYSTDLSTVMKHHVMSSHVHYYPYKCPHCNDQQAVRSFLILHHVRRVHVGSEVRYNIVRDPKKEKQVRDSYCLGEQDSKGCRSRRDKRDSLRITAASFDVKDDVVKTQEKIKSNVSSRQASSKKIAYKCNMCGAKSQFKNDMRHHIMRELQYKPFRCSCCAYSEPSQWTMRKHFRKKHPNLAVEVIAQRDAEIDQRVEKILSECTVLLHETSDPDLLASCTPERNTAGKPHHQQHSSRGRLKQTKQPVCSRTSSADDADDALENNAEERSDASVVHRCPSCSYIGPSKKALHGHMMIHTDTQLKCAHCNFRGPFKSRVLRHWQKVHEKDGLTFDLVNLGRTADPIISAVTTRRGKTRQSTGTQDIRNLLRVVASKPKVEAEIKSFEFDDSEPEHHKQKFKCFYCGEKYQLAFQMRRHVQRVHDNQEVKWISLITGETETLKVHRVESSEVADVGTRSATGTTRTPNRLAKRALGLKTKKTKKKSRKKRISITKKYLSSDPWSAGYRSTDEDDEDGADEDEDDEAGADDDAMDTEEYEEPDVQDLFACKT